MSIFPWTVVLAERGARITVVERISAGAGAFVCGGTEIVSAEHADVTYASLQQAQSGARVISNRAARPGRDSALTWCLAELGADLAEGSGDEDFGYCHRAILVLPAAQLDGWTPADRVIFEIKRLHQGRLIEIAPIENHWLLEHRLDALKIRVAELIPFGEDQQGVSTRERVVIDRAIGNPVTEDPTGVFDGLWIMGADRGSRGEQFFDNNDRRRFAHIVGARLEGEPPNGEAAPFEVRPEVSFHAVGQ